MVTNKFFDLLSTLSFKTSKRFLDFAQSPYFNKSEDIKRFVQLSVENLPENAVDESIFQSLYPQEPYKRDKLYRLRSDSLILLEKFIVYDQVNPNEGINYLSLLFYYVQNDLKDHFDDGYKFWNLKRKDNSVNTPELYYEAFQEEQLIQFSVSKNKVRAEHNKLPETESICLNAFYYMSLFEKQLYLLEAYYTTSRSQNISDLTAKLEKTLDKVLKNEMLRHNILVKILTLSFEMLRQQDALKYFDEIKQLLTLHLKKLPIIFVQNQYTRLNNFCLRQINLGKKEYAEIQFALYQHQIQEKVMYNEKGKVALSNFKNILVIAIRLGKDEWAASFLEEHKDKLVSENPVMVYQYCQARILFEQKKYSEAKKLLANVKMKDLFHAFDVRRMLIKSYYELKDTLMASTELDRFHVYINRKKKISEQQVERNRLFANILKKIMDYMQGDIRKKTKLLAELTKEKGIAERNWLIQKVNELR